MFKRVIWMGVGAAAGSASTVWAQRKVKAQVDRMAAKATPGHAIEVARSKATEARRVVSSAIADGRDARRDAEVELRGRVEDRFGRPAKSRPPSSGR